MIVVTDVVVVVVAVAVVVVGVVVVEQYVGSNLHKRCKINKSRDLLRVGSNDFEDFFFKVIRAHP